MVGLVGGHGMLYNQSPTFHATITTIADLIPIWVDAIAAEAVKADADCEQRVLSMKWPLPSPDLLQGLRLCPDQTPPES